MTHRIPSRRWQENPERRVSQAQLNRVERAANNSRPSTESEQREPTREPRVNSHIQDQ